MRATTPRSATTREMTVAICGNPNCGKTTIFNGVTGLRQKVGNYPGVTVEKVTGQFSVDDTRFTLIDIPGTYSLSAFSPDEYIAAQALFGSIEQEDPPDIIVAVIDATNLERGLYFLFQILQIGRPVVVALNMIDLARRDGVEIDADELSRRLGGIPVVPVVGSRGQGIDELKRAIAATAAQPVYGRRDWYDEVPVQMMNRLRDAGNNTRCEAEYFRILFDAHGPAEGAFLERAGYDKQDVLDDSRDRIRKEFGSLSAGETVPLTRRASELFEDVVTRGAGKPSSLTQKIDRVLLHPFIGPVVLVMLMTLIFQSIFSWAEPIMNLIDTVFGSIGGAVEGSMAPGPLRSLLVDGVIGGVGSVLVFLPQIVILFLFISLLEDSGYMPRAAFLVDRLFGWCGLSGKSFIPMLSSFACAIPGIMATRTIEDRKLRIITMMVLPLMSCSARLPVYAIMIAAFIPHVNYWGVFNLQGIVLTALYLLGIAVAVVVSFVVNRTMLKTERGTFMMELPSYKLPTLQSVIIRVVNRAKSFLWRAGTVILAITIIIWALSYYPRSNEIADDFSQQIATVEQQYESQIAALEAEAATSQATVSEQIQQLESEKQAAVDALANERAGANLRNSYFARMGHVVEPVFEPLGWDWRITMSVLASFPAREVIIATLGTIFNLGGDVDEEDASLVDKMRNAEWESGAKLGEPLFTPAVALSIMIFFALCCQCGATLVTMRQEANTWWLPIAVFTYMTTLAYVSAFVAYQLLSRIGF